MPTNNALSQRTPIPQHIEQAMNQHMQESMPAHLKKYVNSDKPTYVPQNAQKQIDQYMQKSMPAHLKQYAGAYMEQKIVQPNSARPTVTPQEPRSFSPPRIPDKLRLEHSAPGQQYTVDPDNLPKGTPLFQAESAPANGPAPLQSPPLQQPTAVPTPQGPDYSFLMEPPQKPKKPLLPAASSGPVRWLFVGGGLLALMIVFVIVKSLLGGGSSLTGYATVVEDQQELIHLAANASQEQDLSTDNHNFVATAQLSLSSAQDDLLQYMKKNHVKISTKQLSAKISKATDDQLDAAASAGTYNQALQDVMKTKLNAYSNDLKRTYQANKGKVGRALVSSDIDQAQLLINQVDSASTN